VAHYCDPRYLGGRDWEDHGWRSVQVKSPGRSHSNNKSGMVARACKSSYVRGIGAREPHRTGSEDVEEGDCTHTVQAQRGE
jgi:hypothetical protein